LKDSIKGLKGNYTKIEQIRGVYFDWNKEYVQNNFKGTDFASTFENRYYDNRSLGFIAQELEETVPEVVWTSSEGHKTVEYGIIVSIAVGAVKEQQTRIDSIYERINRLKSLVSG
jgi:hypothetical protein